jgi:hypothetical protein
MSDNFSFNKLIVFGDKNLLEDFYEKNKSNIGSRKFTHLSFQQSVPLNHPIIQRTYLDLLDDDNEKYQLESVEAGEKWGTYWDCYCDRFKMKEGCLVYKFDTHKTLPIEWLKIVSEIYPNLIFDLFGESYDLDFRIKLVYENGFRKIYEKTSYQKYHYDLDGGDKIVLDILKLVKWNKKMWNSLIKTKLGLVEWAEETKGADEMLSYMDENECYDYTVYLKKRLIDMYLLQKKYFQKWHKIIKENNKRMYNK